MYRHRYKIDKDIDIFTARAQEEVPLLLDGVGSGAIYIDVYIYM